MEASGVSTAKESLGEAIKVYKSYVERTNSTNLPELITDRIIRLLVGVLKSLAIGWEFNIFCSAVEESSRWYPKNREEGHSLIPMSNAEIQARFDKLAANDPFEDKMLMTVLGAKSSELAGRILAPLAEKPDDTDALKLVLRRIKSLFAFQDNDFYVLLFCDNQTEICNDAPSRWIAASSSPTDGVVIYCSSCGYQVRHAPDKNPNQCPGCKKPIANGGPSQLPDGFLKTVNAGFPERTCRFKP